MMWSLGRKLFVSCAFLLVVFLAVPALQAQAEETNKETQVLDADRLKASRTAILKKKEAERRKNAKL